MTGAGLRVVDMNYDAAGKLTPQGAQLVWDMLVLGDEDGQAFLETTGLPWEAQPRRFASPAAVDEGIASLARRGYRIAGLLKDVDGQPRGVQLLLTRPARTTEAEAMPVKGSLLGRAFFGAPEKLREAPFVAVAEGLLDTHALAAWAEGQVVVGAAGMGFLKSLAGELDAAAIDCRGKLFALFAHNDAPHHRSRRQHVELKQRLVALGARVVVVQPPPEFASVTAWRKAKPDMPWPPPEVARALSPEPGDETPLEDRQVAAPGCAVAIPARVTKDGYAQDFTTLCALLDDASVRESAGLRGELGWCEMSWRVLVGKTALSEVDLSAVRLGLEAINGTNGKSLRFSEDDVAKAMGLLARRRSVHPVRDWLRSVKWDGVKRLEDGLPQALGHHVGSFEAAVLRRWMVSAVARAIRPGCKVDTVLVLVGPQGAYKSTFFEALAGEWFTDAPVRTDDKDGKLVMRRAWVVEWAELDSMRRARDQESVKAFLSARVDLFRKPYGREVVEAPRHCVIVGTTNNREFLHDSTGNRRFWPVGAQLLDVSWVREHREQLWAEAVALFDAGEQWWLTREEEDQLCVVHKEHEAQHPWFDVIADWLEENRFLQEVTTAQVLSQAVGMKDARDFKTADEKDVVTVLRQLGWSGPLRRKQGTAMRRVYVRPEVSS